jgi:hypothetical protein
MASENNSGAVSIFAMVLLAIVVLVILYFVFRGFLFGGGDKNIDVNINPGGEGSYNLLLDKDQIAAHKLPAIRVS